MHTEEQMFFVHRLQFQYTEKIFKKRRPIFAFLSTANYVSDSGNHQAVLLDEGVNFLQYQRGSCLGIEALGIKHIKGVAIPC